MCKHCGIQYVGQTVADFRYQWNSYKDNCRKHSLNEDCMQKHLYDHYFSCNKDFLNTVSVTFIDKTDPSNPIEREHCCYLYMCDIIIIIIIMVLFLLPLYYNYYLHYYCYYGFY